MQAFLNKIPSFAFLNQVHFRFNAFIFSAFCSFLAVVANLSGLQLLIPLAQGIIRNDYSQVRDHLGIIAFGAHHFPQFFNNPHLSFFPLAVIILGFILIQNLLNYAAALSISRQTKESEIAIRQTLFNRYLSFGKMYFDLHHSTEIQNVIFNHASALANQVKAYHRLLSQCMSLIAITLLLLCLSWKLTLLTCAIIPFFFISSSRIIKKIRLAAQSQENQIGNIRRHIANIIACIPLIKAYAAEKEEARLFEQKSYKEKDFSFQFEKKILLIKPIEDINVFLILLALAAGMSFIRAHENHTDLSHYLVFFYVLQMAMTRLRIFSEFKIHLARTKTALEKFKSVMENSGKFSVLDGKREFLKLEKFIEFKNLVFSYSASRPALRGVSFTAEKGKMTAIVGATGSGKTTLFNLLLRFYDCPGQSILLDGNDIREFTLSSLMSSIAYVSQNVLLLDDTLFANLIYGLREVPSRHEINSALATARLDEFVQNLKQGLNTHIGEQGAKLSGGEKQRLSIARALLKKSDILLLDEATSALDSPTEKQIQAALSEASIGKTTLVIAHRLSTILHADKIVVLKQGRVAEEGDVGSLIQHRGDFFEFCQTQNFEDRLKAFS